MIIRDEERRVREATSAVTLWHTSRSISRTACAMAYEEGRVH